jgi:hypothetical protein
VFTQPTQAATSHQPRRLIHGVAVFPLPLVEPGTTSQMDRFSLLNKEYPE